MLYPLPKQISSVVIERKSRPSLLRCLRHRPSIRPTPHSEELPKACWFLAANTQQAVRTACPQGYVETPALGELLEELEERGACLLTGLPGHGKTALALQAMGSLAASHDLKPLWLTRPEQWEWIPGEGERTTNARTQLPQPMERDDGQRETETDESQPPSLATVSDQHQSCPNTTHSPEHDSRHYVVLMDDVFGQSHYDDSKRKAWEELFDLILAKVKAKQVKVILTSRAHIYEECRKSLRGHPLFDYVKNIDLRKPGYWTVEDRKDILNNFLQQANVSVAEPIRNFVYASEECTQIGFPQVCRFFASEKQAQLQGPGFFRKPLQFLYEQFEAMQENDPRSYLVLIMTWLEGGVLSSEFLSLDNSECKRRISDLSEQFGVKDAMTIREARSKARSLCGVYLREDDQGSFRFTHQSICDSLAVAVCRCSLKQALDVCSVQQLCKYVHTEGSAADQSGLTYTVRKSEWPLLAARLVKAMTSEELPRVLHHPCLRDPDFVTELIGKYLTASHVSQMLQHFHSAQTTFLIFDRAGNIFQIFERKSSVAVLIQAGLRELTSHILESEELASLPEAERCRHLREALLAACYVSDQEMVSRLLDRGAEVTADTLCAACQGERDNVSVLEEVLEKLPGKELDLRLYGDLLWTCCEKGRIKCLKFLLKEARPRGHQAVLERFLEGTFTRVLEESHPENQQWSDSERIKRLPEVLSALRSSGAQLDKTSFDIWRAAGHPYAFALKEHLADFDESIPDFHGYNGATLLHEAAGYGSVECLKTLLESPQTRHLDINALDEDAQTPLHRAAKGSHMEAMRFLLQRGADPNVGADEMSWRVQERNQYFSLGLPWSGTHCSPLHAAAATHDVCAIELLMQHGARTDRLDGHKMTPLHHYAAALPVRFAHRVQVGGRSPDRQTIENLLVKSTADINQKIRGGSTPLHLACKTGQLSLIESLLSGNARIDLVDDDRRSVLHALAMRFYNTVTITDYRQMLESIVRRICRQQVEPGDEETSCAGDQDVINCPDCHGRTPLHLAADCGDLTLVEIFLKLEAKVDVQDKDGRTPLHCAACCGDLGLIDALIANGARVDAVDIEECTPLHLYNDASGNAFISGKVWCWKKADERKIAGKRAFQVEITKNRQNARGQTPLHLAARRNVFNFLQLLLNMGAKADIADEYSRLPLHYMAARKIGKDEDMELRKSAETSLVSSTPDVNVQDNLEKTPLHYAAEQGSLSLVVSLLERGARTDLPDKQQQVPLHLMSKRAVDSNTDRDILVKAEALMVKKTADINVRDLNGKTSLHLAAEKGSLSLMMSLLERGARADLVDKEQHLPLHLIALRPVFEWDYSKTRSKVQTVLVENTADINVQDWKGKTPLHLAIEQHDWPLTLSLLQQRARTDLADNEKRLPLQLLATRSADSSEVKEKEREADAQLVRNRADTNRKLKNKAEALLVEKTDDVNIQDSEGKTLLHLALERRNASLTVSLLEHRARTDVVDKTQRCPLHTMADTDTDIWESQESRIRAEALLVEKTDDINLQDSEGKTPLHLAAEQSNLRLVSSLLERDARIDIDDKEKRNPLQVMATKKITEISSETDDQALTLMMEKSENLDVLTKERKTPLHLAAERGIMSWIVFLLKRGARTDLTDNEGRLPLHALASRPLDQSQREGRLEAETLLVEKTADINVQDRQGRTPLHLAVAQGDSSLVVSLLEHGARTDLVDKRQRTPLHSYATGRRGDAEVETLLVKKGSEINAQDLDGKTPLHLAAEQGNMWLMLFLLRHGAKADLKDKMGRCSLHDLAAGETRHENESIMRDESQVLLLKKTADFNARDIDGKTPLHLAADRLNFSLIIFLLDHGAEVDITDRKGRLPLHLISTKYIGEERRPRISDFNFLTLPQDSEERVPTRPSVLALKHLLERTADINVRDRDGKTPLHLSLEHGSPLVTQSLLEHGARTDLVDNDHRLPLHSAVIRRYFYSCSMARCDQNLLVSLTPDLSALDTNGKTALHLAVEQEDSRFVTILVQQSQKRELSGNEKQTSHQSEAKEKAGSEEDDKEEPHESGTAGQRTALINVQGNSGKTALHLAVEGRKWRVATFLLNNGASADLMDKQKRMPLHYLADSLNRSWRDAEFETETLTLLLDKTADVNAQDKDGNTALHRVLENRSHTLMTSLLKHGAKTDVLNHERRLPLHIMAIQTTYEERNTRTKTEQLLEKTADINVQDTEGKTPLYLAAEKGNLSLMMSLLERDARADLTDTEGRLPLHVMAAAPWNGRWDSEFSVRAESLLAEKTPDIDIQDKHGKSPLHLAIENFNWSLAKLLLQRGAKADLVDDSGCCPLHKMAVDQVFSLRWGKASDEVEALLVEKTINVNAQDTSGKAPLHLATEHFIPSLIESLLKREASTDLKDTDGRVPLHAMAARNNSISQDREIRAQTEALLVKKTADIDVQDRNGKTPLHLAAEEGNLPLTISLLERGARADLVDDEKRLPLHLLNTTLAESAEAEEMAVKLLVEKTPDVNLQDKDGATPLHLAVSEEYARLVAALLEAGARSDLPDTEQRLPLHVMSSLWSERDNWIQISNLLLEETTDINLEDKAKKTPPHLEAGREYASLETGVNENSPDSEERILLHFICFLWMYRRGWNLLLEKIGDINVQDKAGKTPLHYACRQGHPSLAVSLLERGARTDVADSKSRLPLHMAAARRFDTELDRGALQQAETRVVEKTADVNARDTQSRTPLHHAALQYNLSLVAALLERGAGADVVDSDGCLPLHLMATSYRYPFEERDNQIVLGDITDFMYSNECFKALFPHSKATPGTHPRNERENTDEEDTTLLKKTADINVQDKNGKAPLHLAAERGRAPLVSALLKLGARADLVDQDGRSPLHLVAARDSHQAACGGTWEKIEALLIEKASDVNVQDKDGKTPLHLATEGGHLSLVTSLLESGARTDLVDNDLRSPLHLVAGKNYPFIHWCSMEAKIRVQYLFLQKTANISVRDKDGKTPLVLALERKDRELVRMLLHHGGKGDVLLREGSSWPADLGYVSEWM